MCQTVPRRTSAARRSATGPSRTDYGARSPTGALTLVVSDHSPCPPALKHLTDGDFGSAWGGIASVQLGLPVVWTEARTRGVDLGTVVGWMATAPADLVGLPQKGRIVVGADADLVAFAPDETLDRRPGGAPSPASGHAVRGARARRRSATDVVAWGRDRPGRPRGRLLRGRQTTAKPS